MTFGTALFLWGVAAGAIPVVLHMINRQKAPVAPFSTLRFLRASVEKTRRRKYIHDLLLLLLRVAALTLIAIALARPAVRWLHQWFGAGASTAVAVIVDNSGSMGTADQNGSRFERVTTAARQILDELQPGDEVAVLITNGPRLMSSRRLFQNHEVARRAIASCRPSFERADLVATLGEARRLVRDATAPNREIYIVTDMQACCWEDAKRLEETNATAEEGPPIVVVDVGGDPLRNSSLTGIELDAAAPVAGIPLRVTTEVQGDTRVTDERNVGLYIDDQKRESSPTLQLQPAEQHKYTFQVPLSEKKLHRGEVRLEGEDACPMDDKLYFAANTDPAVPVAIVKPSEHEIENLDQAYYLERALGALGDEQGAVLIRSLTLDEVVSESLSHFVIVFCVNLPVPSTDVAQQLAAYAANGGHLVWICGENMDPIEYASLNEQLNEQLLPVRLVRFRQTDQEHPEGWHISWLDAESRVVGPFAEPASVHQSVQVFRFIEMASTTGSSVRVLARLNEGQPLLVQRSVGSGELYLLATSLHVDWTNFPLKPLFLPFVSRLTFQLSGSNATQPLLTAGSPWSLPVAVSEDVTVEVVQPNGQVVRLDQPDGNGKPIRFRDTHQVGVYEARIHRGPLTQKTAFAVNPDPEEFAPRRVSREELEKRLKPARVFHCDDPARVTETIRELRKGMELGGVFLLLVLAALLGEAYHANRRALNPKHAAQHSLARSIPGNRVSELRTRPS